MCRKHKGPQLWSASLTLMLLRHRKAKNRRRRIRPFTSSSNWSTNRSQRVKNAVATTRMTNQNGCFSKSRRQMTSNCQRRRSNSLRASSSNRKSTKSRKSLSHCTRRSTRVRWWWKMAPCKLTTTTSLIVGLTTSSWTTLTPRACRNCQTTCSQQPSASKLLFSLCKFNWSACNSSAR